ncbi:MAG: uracil-DNA glycosylase [Desulfobacterales bacterium]
MNKCNFVKQAFFAEAVEEVSRYFLFLSDMGCRGLDCSAGALEILSSWGHPKEIHAETLDSIYNELKSCRRCKLSEKRNRIVFGEGDPSARVMFIGEGPGSKGNETGRPFTGEAGELLTKIIQAIGLTRETVYLCNAVKCMPSGERKFLPEEIRACHGFLKRQIQAVKPEFICTFGSVAAAALLETSRPLDLLRGRFHNYRGIQVMPTYHPAFLIDHPEKKREVWEDMKQLMAAYQNSTSVHKRSNQ